MSYEQTYNVGGEDYFLPPYSLNGLPPVYGRGLIALGALATLSVTSTLGLICFISFRFLTWRSHYRTFLGYNQYVVLVLNLLLADLQQSSAFLITFYWLRKDQILSPTAACFAQGWLLHSGDVSSGFFVLAIAVHTFYTAVYGRRMSTRTFATVIICLWIFAYFLTGLGVGIHGWHYFTRAGAWCWISPAFESYRLGLHYFWVFLVQFGTILIYLLTFYQLRQKTSKLFRGQAVGQHVPNLATVQAVNRITMLMTLYPCVYVILTLPLSSGRMWSMAHNGASTSETFGILAGCFITSCGWVDTLLYTFTRRRLLQDSMPQNSTRRTASNWEADELGSKGITHTRTVTVEGGHMLDALYEEPKTKKQSVGKHHMGFEREHSPSGSIDPILSGNLYNGTTKTEVFAGPQEIRSEEDEEKRERVSALPSCPRAVRGRISQ